MKRIVKHDRNIEQNIAMLAEYLDANKISVRELAIKSGVNRSMISSIINRCARPSLDTWYKIADATGLDFKLPYDDASEDIKDNRVIKSIDGVPVYVFKMLEAHGNTIINRKVVKRLGKAKIKEIIESKGFDVTLHDDVYKGVIVRTK